MFSDYEHEKDWRKLATAIEEAPAITPCTNFPDAWFPEKDNLGTEGRVAKEMCKKQCPVTAECAAYGIKWETDGIWGGLGPKERQQLRRNGRGKPIMRRYNLNELR